GYSRRVRIATPRKIRMPEASGPTRTYRSGLCLHVRSRVDEKPGLLIVRRGTLERRGTEFVPGVHVGTLLDEQLDALGTGVDRGQQERRIAVRVAGVRVDASVELRSDGVRVAIADRLGQLRGERRCDSRGSTAGEILSGAGVPVWFRVSH